MIILTVSTGIAVLAIIGLVVGLVVLLVVIKLLNGVLTPLRNILTDVKFAHTAPMLERGVPGTEQLGQTRRLADSVPQLALAYLSKLGSGVRPAPPPQPAAPAYSPAAASPPPAAGGPPPEATTAAEEPAWKKYLR